jgi:hypothetical protein
MTETDGATELLTAEHFRPYIGKDLCVRGGRHALTLVDVQTRSLSEAERNIVPRQPFNLIFRGPSGDVLPEGIYTLDVEGGASFELYVIPVYTPAPDRQDYQAAFN